MAQITYKKVHPADPETIEWGGRTFNHGEAADFDGRKTDHKALLESARGNPWFEVDGEPASGGRAPTRQDVENAEEGKGAETYRAYAIDWINKVQPRTSDRSPKGSDQMRRRWDAEEELREKVGWGSDDQGLVDTIFKPKLEKLMQAED